MFLVTAQWSSVNPFVPRHYVIYPCYPARASAQRPDDRTGRCCLFFLDALDITDHI